MPVTSQNQLFTVTSTLVRHYCEENYSAVNFIVWSLER